MAFGLFEDLVELGLYKCYLGWISCTAAKDLVAVTFLYPDYVCTC